MAMFAELVGRYRKDALPLVVLAAVAIVGVAAGGSWSFVFVAATAQALLIYSAGMLFGQLNILTLCPCTFAAVGIYAVLWVGERVELPFLAMLVIGGAAAVPVGGFVGLLALRLRGEHLAVVTFTFAVAAAGLINTFGFPGQASGAGVDLERPALFESDARYFLLGLAILVATVAAVTAYANSLRGRAWRMVKHSERAAAAAGRSVPVAKLEAFMVSAAIGGIAGVVMTYQTNGFVTSTAFGSMDSITVVALAVMLGAGNLSGALSGGILVAAIPEILTRNGIAPSWATITFGLGAVLALANGKQGMSADLPWMRRPRPDLPAPRASGIPVAPSRPPVARRLVVSHVSVQYGAIVALDDVSLEIEPGEIHAVIGPNGAGKSTLVDVITGFVRSSAGHVRLGDLSVEGMSPQARARNGLRRTFQTSRAVPEFTVGAYVEAVAGDRVDDSVLDNLLASLQLPARQMPIEHVDVGSRRLIEMVGALAAGPSVLLLDEPAAGLSESEAVGLAGVIRRIPEQFGCAVLLIEHNVELVRSVADSMTVLNFGQVIARGEPEAVLNQPIVLESYLGEEPDVPSREDSLDQAKESNDDVIH